MSPDCECSDGDDNVVIAGIICGISGMLLGFIATHLWQTHRRKKAVVKFVEDKEIEIRRQRSRIGQSTRSPARSSESDKTASSSWEGSGSTSQRAHGSHQSLRATGFANELMEAMYPVISKFLEDTLRTSVEPALQLAVPAQLSKIHFKKLNLNPEGRKPVHVSNLWSEPFQMDTNFAKQEYDCVRIVADIELKSNCEVELAVPLCDGLPSVLGGLDYSAVAGVNGLELHGRIVVELSYAVPRKPFFLGFQVYFSNLPYLDIAMTGMKGLLNVSFMKQKILEVVSKKLKDHMVLPNRITKTLEPITDLISLKSPHPEGILRVMVVEVRGVFESARHMNFNINAFRSKTTYVQIDLGMSSFRSSSRVGDADGVWDESNFGDFLVLDATAQRLHVMLRLEEPGIMGHSSSACVAWCSLPASLLILNSSVEYWDRWWPMEMGGDDDKLKADKSMPMDDLIACLSRSRSGVGVGSDYLRSSVGYTSYDPQAEIDALGPCMRLLMAWRPFHRDTDRATRLMQGCEAYGNWSLQGRAHGYKDEIMAFAQLGVRHVSDLPHELEGKFLHCVAECTHQHSQHAGPQSSKRVRCGFVEPCILVNRCSYGKELSSRHDKQCGEYGLEKQSTSEDLPNDKIAVVFDHPFDFYLLAAAEKAVVTLTVYCDVSKKDVSKKAEKAEKKAETHTVLGSAVFHFGRFLSTEVQSVPLRLATSLHREPVLTCQFKFCVLAPSKDGNFGEDGEMLGPTETSI